MVKILAEVRRLDRGETPVEIFEKYGVNYSYEFNGKVPSGINILRSENVVQEEELLIIQRDELIFNVNTIDTAILASKFL